MSLPLLQSKLMPKGFRHGFTERTGGVSLEPYDSLNVGFKWGDDAAAVDENRRRVLEASGARALFFAKQVHGGATAVVQPHSEPTSLAMLEADAVVTATPNTAVAVIVADCVPVLLADPVTGACAAVHAGWRGTVANVVGATVKRMQSHAGARPKDLYALLGPSIGPCCFEVGDEVVRGLAQVLPGRDDIFRKGSRGRPHADLWRANMAWLVAAGLDVAKIESLNQCSHCQPHRFFSYRRDGNRTGQMLGFISCVAPV